MKKMVGSVCLGLACLAATLGTPGEARRGGSFGSRGARTYYAPRSTRLAPGDTGPVARSMTARPSYQTPSYAPSPSYPSQYAPGYRPRFGFGGGLLTGLVTGGLIGGLLGHHGGFGGYGYGGGGGGLLPFLIQLAIIGGAIWLVMRLFRRGAPAQPPYGAQMPGRSEMFAPSYAAAPPVDEEIAIGSADQEMFERLLVEVQDAFGHEDYGRLRAITTPEVMSFLAEELGDNATHGRRNEVTGTRLLDGEVSEAWREGDADYATIALRYESIDVMRDRTTGAILSGDPARPTETTELWTFVRPAGTPSGWKVSAIQET